MDAEAAELQVSWRPVALQLLYKQQEQIHRWIEVKFQKFQK